MKQYLFALGIIILAGCASRVTSKKARPAQVKVVTQKKNTVQPFQEDVAHLFDMPDAPIVATVLAILKDEQNPHKMQLRYQLDWKQADIIAYYQAGMERHGWASVGEWIGKEALLLFEKPDSRCVIMMKGNKIVITLL